jgi:hypothetical protein
MIRELISGGPRAKSFYRYQFPDGTFETRTTSSTPPPCDRDRRSRPPAEADAARDCTHENFEASISVIRLGGMGHFTTEISVRCEACGEPFRFLGVAAGSSPDEPKVSVDGLELRAPIEPRGMRTESHARCEVPSIRTTGKA